MRAVPAAPHPTQDKPATIKMTSYKLTYFDIKGLGEPIRMLLSILGKDFEDNRIPMASWSSRKSEIKWGRVPVLEIDGKEMYQSQAIMRYLAKQAKLAGDNDWEAYEIDSAAGTIADLISLYIPIWTLDGKSREELKQKLLNEYIPSFMKNWNEQAENSGFLANGKLSWADLMLYGFLETLEGKLETEIVNEYPNLKLGTEKLRATPGIKEWLAKRPNTPW